MMNFADLPAAYTGYEQARTVVLPIPYDKTSTWRKGADLGPQALLAASANMELFDIETGSEVFRTGICTLPPVDCPADPAAMVDEVEKQALHHFRNGKFVVGLGGEHSVTVGLVRAAARKFGNLSVLQFDAHSDLRPEYEGSPFNHACVMSRVSEICGVVQVGIRSMDKAEWDAADRDRIVFAHDLNKYGMNAAAEALELLTDTVYITVDLDVLDPSVMPSTGTPEPGGLDWYTLTGLIRRAAGERTIIGMDVVELLPDQSNPAPDFLAAKLIYRTLSMVFGQ
ncbi:MAG: agmatinase [Desulfobulbaceae bacterium]|jgi:agmatinase|nr:agmatinase [Desulfobulbaceae bacterium]MDY0350105.1 agmatinase [Desulfobulbaceae bacterium]